MTRLWTDEELDSNRWNLLLRRSEHASVFHTREWCRVITESFPNHRARFLIEAGPGGDYRAGLPVVEVHRYGMSNFYSMPLGTYGGPICADAGDRPSGRRVLRAFLDSLDRRKTGRISLTTTERDPPWGSGADLEPRHHVTFVLDLERDLSSIWSKALSPKARNRVRQARRKGVVVRDLEGPEDLRACYALYEETCARHGDLPPLHPPALYENISRIMIPKGLARWFLAEKDGLLLAYVICFPFKDRIFYWDNGSRREFWPLRPNNALLWHMIKLAKRNGAREINLGSCPPTAVGLKRFKESWGGRETTYVHHESLGRAYKVYQRITAMVGQA